MLRSPTPASHLARRGQAPILDTAVQAHTYGYEDLHIVI